MDILQIKSSWVKVTYFLITVVALSLIGIGCSSTTGDEQADIIEDEKVSESTIVDAATPIPTQVATPIPTQVPTPLPTQVPTLKPTQDPTVDPDESMDQVSSVEIDNCSDIPDIEQRSMCEFGLSMGLTVEDMIAMAESKGMDPEEMMAIAESIGMEGLMSIDPEDMMEMAESLDTEEMMNIGTPIPAPTATPTPAPTATPTPREPTRLGISFDSEISSAEVQSWVELAVGEMQDPATDFLGLIWPIGLPIDDEPDPQLFDGAMFSEHRQVLSSAEVNEAIAHFVNWQTSLEGCSDAERREFSDRARVIDLYIRGGADVATAPDPCLKSRSTIYARTSTQDKTTATEIFFHEAYHGLSNYLLNRCATDAPGRSEDDLNNRRWFAEGTAEYFGVYMAAKVEGREDYRQKILKRAYEDLQADPGMGLESAYVQSAAIVLMIERGMIFEEKLLDGSYYHNCSWIDEFDPQAVGIDYIFDNFNKIRLLDGEYSYSSEVISE